MVSKSLSKGSPGELLRYPQSTVAEKPLCKNAACHCHSDTAMIYSDFCHLGDTWQGLEAFCCHAGKVWLASTRKYREPRPTAVLKLKWQSP